MKTANVSTQVTNPSLVAPVVSAPGSPAPITEASTTPVLALIANKENRLSELRIEEQRLIAEIEEQKVKDEETRQTAILARISALPGEFGVETIRQVLGIIGASMKGLGKAQGKAKGNKRKAHVGSSTIGTKARRLTEEEYLGIKTAIRQPGAVLSHIAKQFKVGRQTVYAIKKAKNKKRERFATA